MYIFLIKYIVFISHLTFKTHLKNQWNISSVFYYIMNIVLFFVNILSHLETRQLIRQQRCLS